MSDSDTQLSPEDLDLLRMPSQSVNQNLGPFQEATKTRRRQKKQPAEQEWDRGKPTRRSPPPPLLFIPTDAVFAPPYILTPSLEVQPMRLLTDSQRVDGAGSHRNDGLPKCRPVSIPPARLFSASYSLLSLIIYNVEPGTTLAQFQASNNQGEALPLCSATARPAAWLVFSRKVFLDPSRRRIIDHRKSDANRRYTPPLSISVMVDDEGKPKALRNPAEVWGSGQLTIGQYPGQCHIVLARVQDVVRDRMKKDGTLIALVPFRDLTPFSPPPPPRLKTTIIRVSALTSTSANASAPSNSLALPTYQHVVKMGTLATPQLSLRSVSRSSAQHEAPLYRALHLIDEEHLMPKI
ncbi:hypothetical protein BDZ89DRAFT_1050383 [Hymenopellis radicata]|nr:hypothetical protein BDZ89DRAFT_1050383 [Hymenopellis radicata]